MKLKQTAFLIALFILLTGAKIIENIQGKVVGVSDGDTITILTKDNVQIKVRLEGIDCPEKKQAFGQKAKQFTSDLAFGKFVTFKKTGQDKYGRSLGYIILPDNKNLNKEILKTGFACHFKKYNKDTELANLEIQARKSRRGLWSETNPIAPWDFRKQQK
jgi:endonuclease YncB( thermonuclease family)